MPISILYDSDAERLGIDRDPSSEQQANAIRFAASQGADVINNSYSAPSKESIDNAIIYAQNEGRGGKGCVVVCSSGNTLGLLVYPANSEVSDVLAVGAIDRMGKRAVWNPLQSSGYGRELDIVAPGSNIWTTTWTGGYGSESGTSFSAPQVSAVAALMLSVNPSLTQKQVVDIIEQTAQKVNRNTPYTYASHPDRPNGEWNEEMGYGLVDAYAAINLARITTPVTPPIIPPVTPVLTTPVISANKTLVTGGASVTFSVNNLQSGVTYEWESNGTIVQGKTGSPASITAPFLPGNIPETTQTVRCRARLGANISNWSNIITVRVIPSFYIVNSYDRKISGKDAVPFYPNWDDTGYEFGYGLEVMPTNPRYTYVWDADFTGDCHDWRLWNKSNYQQTHYEAIEACFLSGNRGGSFRITCKVYDRNTLIAEPGFLLEVYPAPGWFRKPDDDDDEEQPETQTNSNFSPPGTMP